MFSASNILGCLLLSSGAFLHAATPPLRVCADPNNLPYSNQQKQGFENELAAMIARDFGTQVSYLWYPQREAFFRKTLNAGACDIVMSVPEGFRDSATTQPYYRSTYVFVSRADEKLGRLTLDDPRLKRLRIGVQMVGNDATNTPPAHALATRGIVSNVRGYMLYGDYAKPNPPVEIVRAVERGDVDVALVWGPLAGYFAAQSPVPLRLDPVTPWFADMQWPMQFDISVGVQKDDQKLLKEIDQVLVRRRSEIDRLLDSYHVPRVRS